VSVVIILSTLLTCIVLLGFPESTILCHPLRSHLPPPPPPPSRLFLSPGLPKASEQAYIEFESIEAIVKTASRTKFFIEFYSTCLEGEESHHRVLSTSYLLEFSFPALQNKSSTLSIESGRIEIYEV